MIKGVNRSVVIIKGGVDDDFEQAIFVVKNRKNADKRSLVDEACRILRDKTSGRKSRR